MRNYSPNLPRDKSGEAKQGYSAPLIALVTTHKENANVSSILLLGHDTTEIEVSAHGGSVYGIAGKWLSQINLSNSVAGTSVLSGVSTPNFDFIVPNGLVRRFVVPISTNPQVNSVQGINREAGLFPAVAFKTTGGNASVLTVEF